MPLSHACVFPLHEMVRGAGGSVSCGCGDPTCKRVGKHPRVLWSQVQPGDHAATPPYGICTGTRSGFFVVDFDSEESFEAMDASHGLPETFEVATPRGRHLYYLLPDFPVKTSGGALASLVDIRGEGGFVVGPGSPHKAGEYSVVCDGPMVAAPGWLVDWLRLQAAPKAPACEVFPVGGAELERRLEIARTYLNEAPPAIDGQRGGATFFGVCCYLMRKLQLPLDHARALVEELYNPKCLPPWSPGEIDHKLSSALEKGTDVPGIPSEAFPGNLIAAAQKPTPVKPSARRTPDPAHEYTHTQGDAPNGDKKKASFATAINVLVDHPDWQGVLQYDQFRRKVYAVNPPVKLDAETEEGFSDEDAGRVATWFECRNEYIVSDLVVSKAAVLASHRNAYHPIKEYLSGLTWDGTDRFEGLAARLFGVGGALEDDFLRKMMIAAVRRVRKPGTQVDTVIVLYGPQGYRKTSFVRGLFGSQWVRSQMPDLAGKDASGALKGYWCVELAELDRIMRTETSTVREFLTRTYDDYRAPYGRAEIRCARQTIFVGTTNLDDFLSDSYGNRRYWPIQVTQKIPTDTLEAIRNDLWAQASALEAQGLPHWFDDDSQAEVARENVVQTDPWHDAILDYCAGRERVKNVQEIYERCLARGDAGALAKLDRRMELRIGATLRRLGLVRDRRRVDGDLVSAWWAPDAVRLATPSVDERKRRAADVAIARLSKN